MRIVAGDAKGKRLYLPKGCPIRPTADVVKEALFNVLRTVNNLSVLDLFAGSGSVGIEALSRGAAKVVFVEKNKAIAQAMADNLRRTGFADRAEIFAEDVKVALPLLSGKQACFDLVFADPPYDNGYIDLTFQCLAGSGLISPEGMLIVQHSVREETPGGENIPFVLTDRRRYGDTFLTFLKITRKECTL